MKAMEALGTFSAHWLCFSRIELRSFDIQQGCCPNSDVKLALTEWRREVNNMTVVPIQTESTDCLYPTAIQKQI